MATVDGVDVAASVGISQPEAREPEKLKRKASIDSHDDSPKRARHNGDDEPYEDRRRRRDVSPARRNSRDQPPSREIDRRKSATQEEKKRGQRLFGGLLSTLSQKPSNTQQKRRLEIERRQQERLQKQRVEDDKKRAEKASKLHNIRMSRQIIFEEEVMQNKHSKMLAMARYLRTRSKPHIYYLPWKPTVDQEDEIEKKIRDTKAIIVNEVEMFELKKERHFRDYGRLKRSPTPTDPDLPAQQIETPEKDIREAHGSEQPEKVPDKELHSQHHNHHSHHHHDESADVLEEADEDMVIY
ncbi:Fc.00g111120.m01.CDS01 [Cosmosporella sp. VM-42]